MPYYRQLADQLAAMVRSGVLAPGTRLPSVRELTREVLVSVITVRRAYVELEEAGLVVARQGQGTFVAPEVGAAARAAARRQGRAEVAKAVHRALRLGLDDNGIRAAVERALEGDQDG